MQKRMGLFIVIGLVMVFLVACTPADQGTTPTVQPTEVAATTAPEPTAAATEAATIEPTATVPTAASLDDFVNGLKSAIADRDFNALQSFMADPFSVGYWLSEGVQSSPAEAAALFESSFLPEDAQIIWADADTDLSQMLQGQSPETFLGPDKELAAALLSYGWGPDAGGEAIQFITQQPDGAFQWELMLYSGFGFTGFPTDVEAVVINADEATFYSGPGDTFDAVATVFGGMPYPVTGVSQDNAWWRLRCYDDNNGLIPQCWVSADPAVTSPTTLP